MQTHVLATLWYATTSLAFCAPAFVDVPVERSGLTFGHSFDEDVPRAFLYNSGFACGGVCVGDVNGDELPDLYFADGARQNALYLNRGNLHFEESKQPALAGGKRWGSGASLIDIDADGDLDLFQVNFDAPIQFFRNDGKGIFTEEAGALGLGITDASLSLSFADADNDGDLDAYLLCNEYYRAGGRPATPPFDMVNGVPVVKPEFAKHYRVTKDWKGNWTMDSYGRADHFFLNEGTRSAPRFRDVSKEAGIQQIGFGLSSLWIDQDLDGDLDLFVANDFLAPDRLYRNDGVRDGIPRFTDIATVSFPSVSWSSMGSDTGDINNDGLQDLFVVDMAPTTHFKSKLNMGKMEGERLNVLKTGWPRQAMRNHLFTHNGSPVYSETAWASGVANSDWSWSPKLADLDQDGFTDIFVTNGMTRNFTDSDHGDVIGDINIARIGKTTWDLYKDLEPMREANLAYRNIDGQRFEKTGKAWGLDLLGLSYNAAYGDLDLDGDLDLVVSDLGQRSRIFENRLSSNNSFIVKLEGTAHNSMGLGAKVTVKDSEGVERTRWSLSNSGFLSQNEPLLHFGLGSATPVSVTVSWQEGPTQQIVPVQPDTKRLVIREAATTTTPSTDKPAWFVESSAARGLDITHQERQFDEFARQPLLPGRLSQIGPALASGDIDGDGDPDLFVGAAAYDEPAIFINEDGNFHRLPPSPSNNAERSREDIDALWFDADGDKDLDLYVVSGSVEVDAGDARLQDRLLINHSEGSRIQLELSKDALPPLADSGSCVTAADYDGDGDLDLFVGTRSLIGEYPLSPPSRLLRNDSTADKVRFVEATSTDAPGLLTAGLVTDATWSDIDRDGDPDLMLAVEWGPPRLFLNNSGKLTEHTTAAALTKRTGWWSAIKAADIDGDGDQDFLLGNVGWNTKYGTPTEKKPTLIYYGDMDGSGTMRIIEAKNSENRLLPVRGKSCSTNAIPSLKQKLPTFRDFAMCDLPGVYSQERLEKATKFEAVCFESGILINETDKGGSPKFNWVALPWDAQLSPINDFAVADLDGQPGLEVLCAQNNFNREPETGLWRGSPGCTLRWSGAAFESLSPKTTGLLLPQETRALAPADFDGDGSVDVAAAQNHGRLLLYIAQDRTP